MSGYCPDCGNTLCLCAEMAGSVDVNTELTELRALRRRVEDWLKGEAVAIAVDNTHHNVAAGWNTGYDTARAELRALLGTEEGGS